MAFFICKQLVFNYINSIILFLRSESFLFNDDDQKHEDSDSEDDSDDDDYDDIDYDWDYYDNHNDIDLMIETVM
jgi:hypothetical protein